MFRKSIGLVRSFHDLNIPYSFTGIGRVFKRSTHFYFDTTTNIGSTSYVKSIKPSKKTRDLDTSTGTGTVERTSRFWFFRTLNVILSQIFLSILHYVQTQML